MYVKPTFSILITFRNLLLTAALATASAGLFAQWSIDAESGLAFQDYNKVRIPNEGGTDFDFNGDFELQGPVVPFRVRVGYTFGEKNHVFGLYAPLTLRYEGPAPFDINFENSFFPEGVAVDGLYRFNSYRLTYRRDVLLTDAWTLGVGFTAKIRDARVQLDAEGMRDRSDDLGFVPLLHLYGAYHTDRWHLYIEGDALAGGPGRAIDVFAGARYSLGRGADLKGGYRILEGGADVEQVYNFTLVNFAVIGVFWEF